MIYLDNAATSWPKPACVSEAMTRFLHDVGASPGRSGHRLANEAERVRLDARETISELVGAANPLRVVFTHNATGALNLAIRGLLSSGDHVITTGMEHNAIGRPLQAATAAGVSVSNVPCGLDGAVDPSDFEAFFRPETRLVVVNHASNVCGTVQPIREIGAMTREHGVPLLVDAAQTAGVWPIDVERDNIDLLALTGHKGLLGPTGTGGLVFGAGFDETQLPPLVRGGTGSFSEDEEHPCTLPDKYEAGTPNTVGLAGLAASVRYVLDRGVDAIREHERVLTDRLITGLKRIPGVRIVGEGGVDRRVAVVSFVADGHAVSDVAYRLDDEHGVMCRPGLHCAPRAHRTLGTLPDGTVRLSPGLFTTADEIDVAVAAVARVLGVESGE